MLKKKYIQLIIGLLVSCLYADQRNFVWTYEYKIMEPGEKEIESYYTTSTTNTDSFETTTTTEHQIELEIGMTENFDFAVYQTFQQEPEGHLKYKGYKFRTRYKIGKKGQYFFDPLIYLEYKGKPDFSEHTLESKLILEKNIGNFTLALNPVLEVEQEDDEWEVETEYKAGLSYQLSKLLNLGVEFKGSEYANYFGPVIAHGTEDVWIALGSAFKIGLVEEGKPEFEIRMLVGINL